MKFKNLDPGFYQITQANKSTNTVFVQKFENIKNLPLSIVFPEPIEVTRDGRVNSSKNYFIPKNLEEMDAEFKTPEEVKKERKSYGAKIGHVTRGIMADLVPAYS